MSLVCGGCTHKLRRDLAQSPVDAEGCDAADMQEMNWINGLASAFIGLQRSIEGSSFAAVSGLPGHKKLCSATALLLRSSTAS